MIFKLLLNYDRYVLLELEIPASRVFLGAEAQLLGTSLAGGTEYMDLWPLIATNAKTG